MYYNHAEILCSELPIYKEKKSDMYFFNELENQKAFKKIGFLLVNREQKLYKPLYQYSL